MTTAAFAVTMNQNDLIELKRAKERARKARYRARQSEDKRNEERTKIRCRVARLRSEESEEERAERLRKNRERERRRKQRLTAFQLEQKRARDRERKAQKRRLRDWENSIDAILGNCSAFNLLPPDDSYDWRLG